MESGSEAQERNDTLEAVRRSLTIANICFLAGEYRGSEVAMLDVKRALGVIKVVGGRG
jgi:hypothetical protein